jgi:hypothetical protein
MWETSKPDSGIGYRAEAQKILVMFVDSLPHDCDLGTGLDPGVDEIAGTGDDIHLQSDAIPAMQSAGVRLLVVSCGADTAWWDSIAAQTGGSAVQINEDGTVPGGVNIPQLILNSVSKTQAQGQSDVWWGVSCDPELEVTLSPEAHHDVPEGSTVDFDETIGVPADTQAGVYGCTVTFYAGEYPEGGVVVGLQNVHISVPNSIRIERIDIKPGSATNTINPKSKGVVPVALLGSDGFDVGKVDVTTLQFGPSGAPPAHDLTRPGVRSGHMEDVNGDGHMDLMCHFRQQDTGLDSSFTEACLTGSLDGVASFTACDSVRVLVK